MNDYLKYIDADEVRFILDVQKTLPIKGFTYIRDEPKIGRNEICKCGSNKKYKKCCGT